MIKQLIANIKTNLKFYRRSRLLVLIGLFLLFIGGLMSIPSMLLITAAKKFDIIKEFFSTLSGFTVFFTAALGLLTLSYHKRNRCIKMVITKPCLPEIWLLSNFLSAIIVCFTLYVSALLISSGLSAIWHIPVQWGLIYVTLNSFCRAIIILSYLIFLAVIFHPGIAVLTALFFQSGLFYYLVIWATAGLQTMDDSVTKVFLQYLKQVLYFIYMILPIFAPFSDETLSIYNSFRAATTDLKYLLYTFIYTVILASFFYVLAGYFLKKKRHI